MDNYIQLFNEYIPPSDERKHFSQLLADGSIADLPIPEHCADILQERGILTIRQIAENPAAWFDLITAEPVIYAYLLCIHILAYSPDSPSDILVMNPNTSIADLNLSDRPYFILCQNGLMTVSALKERSISDLQAISGITSSMAEEIHSKLEAYLADRVSACRGAMSGEVPDWIRDLFCEVLAGAAVSVDEILNVMKDFPLCPALEEFLTSFIEDAAQRHPEYRGFPDAVIRLLRSRPEGVARRDLLTSVPDCPDPAISDIILTEMVVLRMVVQFEDHIQAVFPSLMDRANELQNSRDKEIFFAYLNGYGLQDLALIYGLTYQRIAQILDRCVRNIRPVQEYLYYPLFMKYRISPQQFQDWYGGSPQIYRFLHLAFKSRGGQKKNSKISEAREDPGIPAYLRSRIPVYARSGTMPVIVIDGTKVQRKRSAVLEYAFTRFCQEATPIGQFFERYRQLLDELDVPDRGELQMSLTAVQQAIIRAPYALQSMGNKARTYQVFRSDLPDLIRGVHLGTYQNVEFSTLKLFWEHIDLMRRFDIRDEYELHNILRKAGLESESIKFGRMPIITIGDADRKKQILDLISANPGKNANELASIYEQVYGVRKLVVYGKILNLLKAGVT